MIVKHDQTDIQQTILLKLFQKIEQSLIFGLQRLWTVQILLLIPEQNVSYMPTSVHVACKHTAGLPIGSAVNARASCADLDMQVLRESLNSMECHAIVSARATKDENEWLKSSY